MNTTSYVPLDAPERVERKLPEACEPAWSWRFEREATRDLPGTFVAEIPHGYAWGAWGAVITPDGALLSDVSIEFGARPESHSALRASFRRVRRVDTPVVVLAAAGGDAYFHLMFDVLPRLDLLRRSGAAIDGSEQYLVSSCQNSYQREAFEAAGVPTSRLIDAGSIDLLQAPRLIVPSLPGQTGNMPQWACRFLRRTFLKPGGQSRSSADRRGARLFISRADARQRRVVNEDDVLQLLSLHGFEPVRLESLSVVEQAALFDSAEIVVGPHGAGFTNLVFCRPGTRVIELFSPSYVNVCYWALSNQMHLDYAYVLGQGTRPTDFHDPGGVPDDIVVDLPRLEAVLATLDAS